MKPTIKLSTLLILFFFFTYLIAWGTWFPAFLHPDSLRLLSFIGLFAPAISGLIISFYVEKKNGIRELLSRYKRLRFGLAWYVLAVLLVPCLFTLSFWFDHWLFHASFGNILMPNSLFFVVIAFIWLMFVNSGEEIGWRGFALPRLQKLFRNNLYATLVLGLLWSTWHIPIYLTPGQSSFPLILFFLFTNGLSFIYTVLFDKTGGSLVSVVLLHASTDLVPRVINIILFKPTTWFILGIITWLSALILIFLDRKNWNLKTTQA